MPEMIRKLLAKMDERLGSIEDKENPTDKDEAITEAIEAAQGALEELLEALAG